MKKRKVKLFASIASLAMVVAVMGVGVWAATQQSVKVESTVSFQATGIVGNVQLGVAGPSALTASHESTNLLTDTATLYSFNADKTNSDSGTAAVQIGLKDANNDGFFSKEDTATGEGTGPIVYTFTINNTATTDIDMYYNIATTAHAEQLEGWTIEFAAVDPDGEGEAYDGPIALGTGVIEQGKKAVVTATIKYTGEQKWNNLAESYIPDITISLQNTQFGA